MPGVPSAIDQRLFGLHVRSNRAIPFASPAAAGEPDVTATFGTFPPGFDSRQVTQSVIDRDTSPYSLGRAGDSYVLTYGDGTQFVIERDAVWMTWQPPLNFDDACTYLVGGAFALIMRLRGHACLHASSVTIGGCTIAIAGPSGAGKSTLAAALVARGATLVSEDVLPLMRIDGAVHAVPSHRGIRLWPEAAKLLTGRQETYPLISPTWDKRILEPDRVATAPVPLTHIFILEEETHGTPVNAAMRLVANSYRPEMNDGQIRREEFILFSELVTAVAVRTLVRDAEPDVLAGRVIDACRAI